MSYLIESIRLGQPNQHYSMLPTADSRYKLVYLHLTYDAFINIACIFAFTNPFYRLIHLGVTIVCFERYIRLEAEDEANRHNCNRISIVEYERTLAAYTILTLINFTRFLHSFLLGPGLFNTIFTVGYAIHSYMNVDRFSSFHPNQMVVQAE